MAYKVVIAGKTIRLPVGMHLIEMLPSKVKIVLHDAHYGVFGEYGPIPSMGSIRLRDGEEFRIFTRQIRGSIHWCILDLNSRTLAGGVFRSHKAYNRAKYAAAVPRMRGRGLYTTVLRYIRKEYKKPLISDHQVSMATLKAWLKAGAKISWERSGLVINPKRDDRIWCFLALEAVKC